MTPAYSEIDVTLPGSATHNLAIYVTRFDGTTIGTQPVTVSPGHTITIPINNAGRDGMDNRMQVRLVYWLGGASGAKTSVEVTTDQGMPTFPTIDSVGCAGKIQPGSGCPGGATEQYNRRLNVTVPR
jgi:hypothetical protein